jgi:hypothetical protein
MVPRPNSRKVIGADVIDTARPEQFLSLGRVLTGEDTCDQAHPERDLPPNSLLDVRQSLPEGIAAGDLLVL